MALSDHQAERTWFVTTARVFGHDLVEVVPHSTGFGLLAMGVPRDTPSWSGRCKICLNSFVAQARRDVGFNVCGQPYLNAVDLKERIKRDQANHGGRT